MALYAKSAGSSTGSLDDGHEPPAGGVESARRTLRSRCWCGLPIWAWLVFGLLVLGGIVGWIVGGVLSAQPKRVPPSATQGSTAPSASSKPASPASSAAPAPTVTQIAGLHRSFFGICYEPSYIRPGCNFTQAEVTRDMGIVSQLTTRVRLYSSECGQVRFSVETLTDAVQDLMVLKAIRALELNIEVWLGIGVNATNATVFDTDPEAARSLLRSPNYSPSIAGAIVGNEYILTERPSAESYAAIKSHIDRVSTALRPLSPGILIGGADTVANLDGQLRDGNMVLANIHAWWSGASGATAADDLRASFKSAVTDPLGTGSNVTSFIGETGWPVSLGAPMVNGNGVAADATQLNAFLASFLCQANAQGLRYFWFAAFDEPWKVGIHDLAAQPNMAIEGSRGLFGVDKKLKPGVVIPECR